MSRKGLWVALCLLILAAALGVSSCSGSGSANPGQPANSQKQQVSQTQNLVNGTISVGAGSYYDRAFVVTGSMTNAAVSGSFNARAALGDNIEVYIFSDLAFENWSHGSTPPSGVFYSSGRITTDNIHVSLGAGSYHLVLSNKYSLISTKQVTTTVGLAWVELR